MGVSRKRIFSFLVSPYTFRCGVGAIILTTVGYSLLGFLPMLNRDQDLLDDASAVDVRGIRLEGELQIQMQESRRRFLNVVLASGGLPTAELRLQSMRAYDATIAQTESQLAALSPATRAAQQTFHQLWARYQQQQQILIDRSQAAGPDAARQLDIDLGKAPFLDAIDSVRNSSAALETAATGHIFEASHGLNLAGRELLFVSLIQIGVLSLLVWMDWRRARTEAQLRRATSELRASEDSFRRAFESAAVGMGIFKLDGTVISVNRTGAKMLGYEQSELIGSKIRDIMAPEFRDLHLKQIATLPLGSERSYVAERRVLRKDGTTAWVRNSVTLMEPDGEESYYFSISEEITEQKEAHDRLAWLANYDPVTKLSNRRCFEEQLEQALQAAVGRLEGVALLYFEIDSFDFLKGTFGRRVADEILAELGARLTAFQQDTELFGRLDDHVFGMLIRSTPDDDATLARAAGLQNIFHRASETGKHRIPISASIGVAHAAGPADTITARTIRAEIPAAPVTDAGSLLKYARAAMFEARSRGGDSIFLADPALQERAAQRHLIESALVKGLRQDEFRVVFQPQFEIATGKLVRFEALCRWNSADLGPIPPDRFIPIAEQTGLITEIGRRIMHEALHQAKTWTDSGRRIGIGVNISPMQFMRPDFLHIVTEALASSHFPPALLELEITEGIFIRDLNLAVARIRELQRLGLSIALDDFGTGYSSLSYLQRMPIDAVKLDRSFVSDITTNAGTVSMVRSVLAMAGALNLRVVTEGVETVEQLDILRALGCDEAQGYLLGRPESAEMALRRVLDSPLPESGTKESKPAQRPPNKPQHEAEINQADIVDQFSGSHPTRS
jgi:PAS domain S-box-containing protein/diguanylate cyclase (GGDEF)-like protein